MLLQTPRPETDLAGAGISGGELVLAVDDREIRDFTDVQAAIRDHPRDEDVRLLLQRADEEPVEVHVPRNSASPA
jgi:S1-C subfamily serine protease